MFWINLLQLSSADKYFLAVGDFCFQTEGHNSIFCLAHHQSRSLIGSKTGFAGKTSYSLRLAVVCWLNASKPHPETLKLARMR